MKQIEKIKPMSDHVLKRCLNAAGDTCPTCDGHGKVLPSVMVKPLRVLLVARGSRLADIGESMGVTGSSLGHMHEAKVVSNSRYRGLLAHVQAAIGLSGLLDRLRDRS